MVSLLLVQDGQVIDDVTWTRYRKSKNSLKIRHANLDDTGVYACKGVNGFGSVEAIVELIVVGELAELRVSNPNDVPTGTHPPVTPPPPPVNHCPTASNPTQSGAAETTCIMCAWPDWVQSGHPNRNLLEAAMMAFLTLVAPDRHYRAYQTTLLLGLGSDQRWRSLR